MLQATGYPAEIAYFYSAILAGYWGGFLVAKIVRLVIHMKHVWLWHHVNPQNFTIHSKWLILQVLINLPRSMLSSRLNLPVFRQIQDIKRCLTLADILYTSVSIRWVFCNACHFLRQKFGYFFFEKHVKFPAIFSSFTKTTERTQPRPQCFSVTVPFLAKPLL